jgi:hypothetical protein
MKTGLRQPRYDDFDRGVVLRAHNHGAVELRLAQLRFDRTGRVITVGGALDIGLSRHES